MQPWADFDFATAKPTRSCGVRNLIEQERTIEPIEEGYDVFLNDGEKAFGAVRHVAPKAITIFVENGGNFSVPIAAIKDVHSGKVLLHFDRLDARLQEAVRQAHNREDPTI